MGSQVVLATAGYDHSIRFWEATSGLCYRTLQYADSQVAFAGVEYDLCAVRVMLEACDASSRKQTSVERVEVATRDGGRRQLFSRSF